MSYLGLPLFVAIFVDHENGGNRGKKRDDTCKASWMKEIKASLMFTMLFTALFVEENRQTETKHSLVDAQNYRMP